MVLKVLHLRSSSGFFGAERVIITLMKRSPQDGINAVLACIENYISGDQSLLQHALDINLPAIEIPCNSRLDLNTIRELTKYCRNQHIDIIHTHDYKSHFYGGIVSRLSGCKLVATIHGRTFGDIKNRLFELIEDSLLRLASHIVVVSESLLYSLNKSLPGKKTTLIANGVDDHAFSNENMGYGKSEWGFKPENFLFGTIARMSEEKGHRVLLDAFKNLTVSYKNARLLLVGDGPLAEELKQQVCESGLQDKVNFTGPRSDIECILNDLDCYVSPSHTEGMPMSILEAMATGLPIVATEVGSVRNLLCNGCGSLVPAGDISSLEEAMQFIMDNIDLARDMGVKSRARVETQYSAAIQSRQYANIYQSVLKNV